MSLHEDEIRNHTLTWLREAIEECLIRNIPRDEGGSDFASEYWRGYRAAATEVADLLDETALAEKVARDWNKPMEQL